MDYGSLHGQDISNVSSSFPHRMPTVSAAQALQDLNSPSSRCISTSLQSLDAALQNRDAAIAEKEALHGGISRGQVTEIYGPPGVGKTALGVQLTANALRAHQGVIWVDAAQPFPGPRLKEVLSCSLPSRDTASTEDPPPTTDLLKNLTCFTTPTLPHLIALLCHTTPSFLHQDTSLIIIDSFSTLVACAYPRSLDTTSITKKQGATPKYGPQQWAAARKWSVFQFVISSLQKLATLRNVAVVILNQTVTKMQSGSRAILIPAISSTAWNASIATSIVLFRDWGWEEKHVRFAKVLKAGGVVVASSKKENVVTFTIESHGLKEAHRPDSSGTLGPRILALLSRKRKADEILDSEDDGSDEDYGWAEEDDEELPQPPPQWQGSEDILVPRAEKMGEEEDEEEEGEKEEKEDSGESGE